MALNKTIKTILVSVVFLYSLVLACVANAQSSAQQSAEITQAKFVFSESLTPPSPQTSDPVLLPHNWELSGLHGSGWYELKFSASKTTTNESWAVYLPEVIMNAQVWLNGTLVGANGQFTPPVSRYWHTPIIFRFPGMMLQPDNTLQIRVVTYTNQHGKLGKVLIGPEAEIQNLFAPHYFKSVTLNIICGAFTLSLAILLFSIWLKRRDSEYFWFSVTSLMWSVYSANIFIHNIPIAEQHWEKLVYLCSGWLAVSIGFLMIRLDGKYYQKIERYLLVCCAIWNVAIVLSPEKMMFQLFPYWLQFCFVISLVGIGHLAWQWLKNRKKQSGIILMLIICVAVAGFHDVAAQSDWIDADNSLWLDYSLPMFFLIMGYLLVSRFIRALEEKETLNLELEDRVKKAGELLEENHQKILAMETQQATTQERQRIHRDLHDSIGAKLLSLVYRSSTDEQTELARSALADLRGVVQQAPKVKSNLSDAIYEWEQECLSRCNEVNTNLVFHIHHLPSDILFNVDVIESIHSILTEALSNAIKHCDHRHNDSRTISIVVCYRLNILKFTVKDQNDYSQVSKWQQGVGMGNMQFRVNALNGKIKWRRNDAGGQVSWIFPLENNNDKQK